ncbi:MAG TPA: CorA family divalent cation transporter [Candidatus Nanopelagicales bacterium]
MSGGGGDMQVRTITAGGARVVPVEALPTALAEVRADPTRLLWVDLPVCDQAAVDVLVDVFGFAPTAIQECIDRQRMPKVHAYPDHLFVVLHSPERGERGHVHYVELDQFIADRVLVTVHGPTNPAVPVDLPVRDTDEVWSQVQAGALRPTSAMALSHAIASAVAEHMEAMIEQVTADVWSLEQQVTAGAIGDPETFLDEMFRTRHALLAVGNVSGNGYEVYERMLTLATQLPDRDRALVADSLEEIRGIHRLAVGQREYLQGVIEFYRTRTDTKMAIAAERLAVIAVVTLPITALASVLGMNVIVNATTQYHWLGIALVVMIAMSLYLLRWAKRHGWW